MRWDDRLAAHLLEGPRARRASPACGLICGKIGRPCGPLSWSNCSVQRRAAVTHMSRVEGRVGAGPVETSTPSEPGRLGWQRADYAVLSSGVPPPLSIAVVFAFIHELDSGAEENPTLWLRRANINQVERRRIRFWHQQIPVVEESRQNTHLVVIRCLLPSSCHQYRQNF
ncbi:hypothetical protein BDV95DRAFT_134082 [Massariosphaeria phaeospora]|uniref:Uncharacterized protein n=1 Tax=Massariosphaeria phaeospora TaxID=100035 RepID=A0A7C8MJB4_9PLEO|nr:hypothetical protein BDV95DRAFT_134082 [Massariosphaeria phaeospora]